MSCRKALKRMRTVNGNGANNARCSQRLCVSATMHAPEVVYRRYQEKNADGAAAQPTAYTEKQI